MDNVEKKVTEWAENAPEEAMKSKTAFLNYLINKAIEADTSLIRTYTVADEIWNKRHMI